MRVLGLVLALTLIAGLAPVAHACDHFVAWVSCGPSPMIGQANWTIEWNDGGSSCCSKIKIFEQDNCTGAYNEIGETSCAPKRYVVLDSPGQKAFRLDVYGTNGELAWTRYLNCLECD